MAYNKLIDLSLLGRAIDKIKALIPIAGTASPKMDGTATVGSSTKYAKEDHIHPSDTSKVSKSGDTMSGTLSLAANKYYDKDDLSGLNANNSDIIGLNAIYMNDASDDGREGINFQRDSTHWDSLYAYAGKLYFTPNRPKGSAQGDLGVQELYSRPLYELGTTDISMRPMVSWARANRLVFLPADQIIIEQTIDGGTTWTSSNISDASKINLFSDQRPTIVLPRINNERNELCGIRITFTAMKYDVPSGTSETDKYQYWNKDYVLSQERYTNLREMWFWLGSNGDLLRCQVECATGAKPDTWVVQFNKDVGLTGWSGSDWVRWTGGPTFGGGTGQTGNYWNWRVTFWSKKSTDGVFHQSTAQAVYSIAGYGDSAWGTPNALMKYDHLYTYDGNKNATFPANITATSFIGSLTGNVTGNLSGNAGTVNNHTVDSDVPTNAKFILYGTCETAAGTAAKVVECDDFDQLITGTTIYVKFTNSNSVASPTLNVNDSGAINIYRYGTTAPSTNAKTSWQAGSVISFTYDGTSWIMNNWLNNDTTDITDLTPYAGTYIADSVVYRYQLLFEVDENTLSPLNNVSNSTGTTKTMLTDLEFNPFGKIFFYYATATVQAGASIAASNMFWSRSGFNLRYTFNCGTTLTAHKPFYLVVTPTANGKCKIASSTPWAQELPTEADGNWYILIGRTYTTYQAVLYHDHPVFYHNGTSIQEVLPQTALATTNVAGLMSSADKTKLDGLIDLGWTLVGTI